MSRTLGRLLAAWASLAIASATATAQEADAPDDDLTPRETVIVEREPGVENLDVTVEQWVFGGQGVDAIRKRIEGALAQNIKRFDQKYGLTPIQKKKLELAGRYDMKRFFDRVDEAKAEYRRVKGDWNQMGDRIFALQRTQNQVFTELFGDQSMLAKTLKTNLTLEQIARHDKSVYRQRVEWMAALLHNRLGLNPDQRRGLVTLIVEETPPLRRYGSFDYDAIMFQLSRLPRDKLRAVLDEGQCRELTLRFDQARRMESILRSEGYLSREKAATDRTGGPAEPAGEKAAFAGRVRAGGDSP